MPTIVKLNRPEFSLDYDVNYPHPKGCELATAYLSLWPIRTTSSSHPLHKGEFSPLQRLYMKTYFIVAQADTDSEGYLKNTAIFCDNDGNTELYVSAEEARESIARTVAEFADVMSSLSFNDSLVPIDLDAARETGLVQEVIKGIKAEDAQDVWISFGDGSQRTYTIKALTI